MDYVRDVFVCKDKNGNEKEIDLYKIVFEDSSIFCDVINEEISIMIGEKKTYDISLAKKRILNYVISKTGKVKYWAVAEFFMHVFLRTNMLQTCSFLNLEGKEPKKGFDGLYLKGKEYWLAESKSTVLIKDNHKQKIKEALTDLEQKITGENPGKNNPWQNAINHITCFSSLGLLKSHTLKKKLKTYCDDYVKSEYSKTDYFNLIPCSTLFFDSNQTFDDLKSGIEGVVGKYSFKKIIVLCIDNKLVSSFVDFLKEDK